MPKPWKHSKPNPEPRLLLATTIAPTLRAFLLPLAQHFRSKGWRVDAIAHGISTDPVCRSAFERVWEADWHRSPLYYRNLMMVPRIRDLARRHRYDIVHVHTPVAGFVTRLALAQVRREQNTQVLYTAHGFHFHSVNGRLRNKLFEVMERKAASWTDSVVVINREDLKAAKERRLFDADRVSFMPGIGVDRTLYSPAAVSQDDLDRLHSDLGIAADTPVLLMVAEFTKRKRHKDALLSFSKVAHPEAHLLLAGSGPLLEAMKRLVAKLNLAGRVHFLGQRSDIPVLMKAARALLLPSSQEGLPRCVMEAMSMGLPVIGSRIRGTAELLEHNAGMLVTVGDVNELAQAMIVALEQPTELAAMGKAGQRQSETYDVARILRMHEEFYGQALERSRSITVPSPLQSDLKVAAGAYSSSAT